MQVVELVIGDWSLFEKHNCIASLTGDWEESSFKRVVSFTGEEAAIRNMEEHTHQEKDAVLPCHVTQVMEAVIDEH